MPGKKQTKQSFLQKLHKKIDNLYNGTSKRSRDFRWSLLAFDAITILYFVAASFFHHVDDFHIVEEGIGIIYLAEFSARLYISKTRWRDIFHPVGLADLIVIASLLAPSLAQNSALKCTSVKLSRVTR